MKQILLLVGVFLVFSSFSATYCSKAECLELDYQSVFPQIIAKSGIIRAVTKSKVDSAALLRSLIEANSSIPMNAVFELEKLLENRGDLTRFSTMLTFFTPSIEKLKDLVFCAGYLQLPIAFVKDLSLRIQPLFLKNLTQNLSDVSFGEVLEDIARCLGDGARPFFREHALVAYPLSDPEFRGGRVCSNQKNTLVAAFNAKGFLEVINPLQVEVEKRIKAPDGCNFSSQVTCKNICWSPDDLFVVSFHEASGGFFSKKKRFVVLWDLERQVAQKYDMEDNFPVVSSYWRMEEVGSKKVYDLRLGLVDGRIVRGILEDSKLVSKDSIRCSKKSIIGLFEDIEDPNVLLVADIDGSVFSVDLQQEAVEEVYGKRDIYPRNKDFKRGFLSSESSTCIGFVSTIKKEGDGLRQQFALVFDEGTLWTWNSADEEESLLSFIVSDESVESIVAIPRTNFLLLRMKSGSLKSLSSLSGAINCEILEDNAGPGSMASYAFTTEKGLFAGVLLGTLEDSPLVDYVYEPEVLTRKEGIVLQACESFQKNRSWYQSPQITLSEDAWGYECLESINKKVSSLHVIPLEKKDSLVSIGKKIIQDALLDSSSSEDEND